MATSTPVVITNLQAFTDAFTDEVVAPPNSQGRWRYETSGSTASPDTGPSPNNTLSFIHTECSSLGSGGLSNAETNGIANFADVPDQTGRTLHLRLCIQGNFNDGLEGMRIEQRASDSDTWAQVVLLRGWAYTDTGTDREAGDTITDEGGVTRTIVADGGWVDFEVSIPDTATQVRLHPRYIGEGGNDHQHDISLRSFFWEWPDDATADGVTSNLTLRATPATGSTPIRVQDAPVVMTAESVFTDAFVDEQIGEAGRWTFDADAGSTPSGSTGPTPFNQLTFIHTETSNLGTLTLEDAEALGIADFAVVPDETNRVLHLRLCIQGDFDDGTEGLEIQHRVSDSDAWAQAGFVWGWPYSGSQDARSAGATFTDYNNVEQTVAVDGGWVDFEISIPDTATQVRLQPRYVDGGNTIRHDIALRQFLWEYDADPVTEGDFWVVDQAGELWRINPNNPSDETGRYGKVGDFESLLHDPQGVTTLNGFVYVVPADTEQLWRINPENVTDGTNGYGLVGNTNFPNLGLIGLRGVTALQGDLWIVRQLFDLLYRINPNNPSDETGRYGAVGAITGGGTDSITGITALDGDLWSPDTRRNIFWRTNPNNPRDDTAPYGPVPGTFPAGLTASRGVAALEGDLWVVHGNVAGQLWRLNPDNPSDENGVYGLVGAFPAGLLAPRGITALHFHTAVEGQTSRLYAGTLRASAQTTANGVASFFAEGRTTRLRLSTQEQTRFGFDDAGAGFDLFPFAPSFPYGRTTRLDLTATRAQAVTESGGVTAYFAEGRATWGFLGAGNPEGLIGVATDGETTDLSLTATQATGVHMPPGVFGDAGTSTLTLSAAQATGMFQPPGVSGDAATSTLTLTATQGRGTTVPPAFRSDATAATLTLTASQATGVVGFNADGVATDLTLTASQPTAIATIPSFIRNGETTSLTLTASEATGNFGVATDGEATDLTLTAAQATGVHLPPGLSGDGVATNLTLTASQAAGIATIPAFIRNGRTTNLTLTASQATASHEAQVNLNSIPPQVDELCRALITTGTAEWWYNNRIGDATQHGAITGDFTIVMDPTPGESDTDVALEIGTFRWFGAGGTSDQFLIRRHDPAPPAARGFNGWLTQGDITGDDRVRLNQVTFDVDDPGDRYSVFFVFTATGDVIELELREVLGSQIGSGHHFMNLRIPAAHHAAFDAVGAGQDINFVLAQRTSLFETDGETTDLTLGASQATGQSDVPQFNADGVATDLTLTATRATAVATIPAFIRNGRTTNLTLAASQATGASQLPGTSADGTTSTLTLTASQATAITQPPGFRANGQTTDLTLTASQATANQQVPRSTADGVASTLTLTASQATGATAVAGFTADGGTTTLTLTVTEAAGGTVAPVDGDGETSTLTLTVSTATATTQAPTAPGAPTNVRLLEGGQTTVLIGFTAPQENGGLPITDYEYELDGGAWQAIGNLSLVVRVTGLSAGQSYSIRIRAVNAVGEGAASTAFRFAAHVARRPGETRSLFARATGRTSVELTWIEASTDVEGDDPVEYYEVAVVYEDGTQSEWERTEDATTRWTVRGLAAGHRYGFRVRAVNSIGAGPQTAAVYVVPASPAVLRRPVGRRIPLLDADRQSLVVQLGGVECRLHVWWQPSALSWWASLEAPIDTQAVQGRRLALNGGILDRTVGILDGNIVLRELGDTGAEPGRDSWRRPTHSLVWEPA